MTKIFSLDKERIQKNTAIEMLMSMIEPDLKLVNQIILKETESRVSLIPKLASHIISSGGKRLRPMLTLASAKLCNYQGERHIKLAACVEFIHTATLLHDDVVDSSSLRRGVQTANTVWGNEASVLVGDYLFSRAFELMVSDGSLKVLEILSKTSAIIAEGEVHQLLTKNDLNTSEDTYLDVIEAKTAALFSASCMIGGVVADRKTADQESLKSYGKNLGIVFQLIDDVLDYSSSGDLGKSHGDDFKEGKITIPVILAFRRGNTEERTFWRKTMVNCDQSDTDFKTAIKLMEKHNSIRDTIQRARHYGNKAKDALAIFPNTKTKETLINLVDYCINRTY